MSSMQTDLDWLIVGGGVHGTYLSNMLLQRAQVPRERLRVLDPNELPLASFFQCAEATGMRYLRSPVVHHLELDPYALRRFGRSGPGRKTARFFYPYERPGLAFFRQHVEFVVAKHRLGELRIRSRAQSIRRVPFGYSVETEHGQLTTRKLVLALGLGEQLCRPAWAKPLAGSPSVQHLFDPAFSRSALTGVGKVLIVGGGISAAQLACSLSSQGVEVQILARHQPRVFRFDSEPEWLGPRAMERFGQASDPGLRRAMIREARHRGSMPGEVATALRAELRLGRVQWLETEIVRSSVGADGVSLWRSDDSAPLLGQRVVLATGFELHRPGGKMVDEAVASLGLACGSCGYPLVSRRLEWAPGLFVSGPLSELELGPSARNIAGARSAGERLLAVA